MTVQNRYKKTPDNGWGAWIDTGYGKKSVADPTQGDTVLITTKAGETHERIVDSIIQIFASGCIVSLIADQTVADNAQNRYQTKAQKTPLNKALTVNSTYTRAQKAKIYDDVQNEGCSDGYNPYR